MELKRGEIMRKGRVIVILCLSLILCFMCVTTNTFSWFNRTEEKDSGNTLVYRNTLKQSSGRSFVVDTYMQDDGGQYPKEPTGNTIGKDAPLTLKPGERQCFKTQIKSNNTSNQNVSLYLSGVKSNDYGNTYVGVNNPMRTYKNVGASESKTKNENGMKNVYVGIYSLSKDYDHRRFKLHWWKSDNTKNGDADIGYLHSVEYKLNNNDNYHVYHAEVPWDAIDVGIEQDDQLKGGHIPLKENNFVCLLLNEKGDWRQDYGLKVEETPAGIKSFYSQATVNVGGKIDLTAYGNGELKYESDNSNIAEVVPGSNGKVYVKGKIEGDAIISVTSTGTVCDKQGNRKPDTQTFTCVVHVKPVAGKLTDVPVVTNMKIAKYTENTKQNIVTVYWYLKNIGTSDITVSVDNINVTL